MLRIISTAVSDHFVNNSSSRNVCIRIDIVNTWVTQGGSILLVGDPFSRAITFCNQVFGFLWDVEDIRDTKHFQNKHDIVE